VLFPRILGGAWDSLPDVVRRGHELEPAFDAHGRFTVTHGTSLFARVLARLMGMPAAGTNIETRLEVRAKDDELVWHRDFSGTSLDSRMYALEDGRIAERRGLVEACLRVTVSDGGIDYRCDGMRLCIGRLRVTLPSWLAPRIDGRAWADAERMRVRISITSWMGPIVTYEGPLEITSGEGARDA
jgi:hypothetical protein